MICIASCSNIFCHFEIIFCGKHVKQKTAKIKEKYSKNVYFNEYYVYFYDYNEEDREITSAINSKLPSKKIYKVDTSSALNNNYVSEESNKSAKNINELKVKASTIIKISGEEIVEYYEGEEIINNLK